LGKTIFIAFLRPPVGSTMFVEGLRVAGGLVKSEDHNRVIVALMGKGARCALRGVDRSYAVKFVDLFPSDGGHRFYVEEESLRDEGIRPSQTESDFEIVPRKALQEMMSKADHCISF
jgi:sulfur relay (sulfurtransferase) DsrF/TusC family protein